VSGNLAKLNRALLVALCKNAETANTVADRIEELECENAELRKDKERLDLLASRYWAVPVTKEYTDHIWMIDHDTPDLRAAIDARAKEGGAT